ncbi:hypothetical protein AWB75_06022 [Caballeronia catudaia]|uniref:Uncharacterized protein n=1 Tax=Caballeronia catudaia TaxID=1777136 RepID=A0A158D0G3_9BURK|nr:hypothetical protein [Caballeronia catudaia]SAK88112.1 hypothetical protein AWB75_06022 [Caballeronia catudaia]
MSVVLPPAESSEPRPNPPRPVVWLVALVVTLIAGGATALLTWPKGEPTGTAWFWIRLFVIPPLSWGLAFGLRLFYREQENDRIEAENEALQEAYETALQFASEPLAVNGVAYLTGLGTKELARKLADGSITLTAQTTRSGVEGIRHSALTLEKESIPKENDEHKDDDPETRRYRNCFDALIAAIAPTVKVIAFDIPFGVRLQLPDETKRDHLRQVWQTCWDKSGLRRTQAVLTESSQGVMSLDEWLDIKGGPRLEKALLFVSVQLHETPPQNSAEVAVALILSWLPLAQRRRLPIVAHVHRPVEAISNDVSASITTALQWGRAEGKEVEDLWQSGVERAEKDAISQCMSDLAIGVSATPNFSGLHNIDAALGCPGSSAGWMALALGVEQASGRKKAQLIAWREASLRFLVVQPVAQKEKTVEE